MPDMLVKLYDLEKDHSLTEKLKSEGIVIRNVIAPEKHIVSDWIKKNFNDAWASECEVSFSNHPISCLIATKNDHILGFACYEATCKNFFGPTGVHSSSRGKGIGKALLLEALIKMSNLGYAYAIIGGAGPVDFYKKSCNAVAIDNSFPGIYKGMLR